MKSTKITAYTDQKLHSILAFENGIKDAIMLFDSDYEVNAFLTLVDKGYFHSVVFSDYGYSFYLLFRYEKDLQLFKDEFYHLVKTNTLYLKNEEFGLLMGYPPAACAAFNSNYNLNTAIFVSWNGMFFSSYPDTLKDDVLWLLENKPLQAGDFFVVDCYKYDVLAGWEEDLIADLPQIISEIVNS